MFTLFRKEHKRIEYKTMKTIWPYKEGYGVYFKKAGITTLICSGLHKSEAEGCAKELNK